MSDHQNDLAFELRERMKELRCLYRVSSLNEQELSIGELLAAAVELIPEGMQFPENAGAAIRFQNRLYKGAKFRETEWKLEVERKHLRDKSFSLTVCYSTHSTPSEPFLKEEFQLIHALADMLILKIERRLGELELKASRDRYQSLVQSVDGIVWEADADSFEFHYVSPQVEKILGYTAEEWYAEKNFWANHIHPTDREKAVRYCIDKTREGIDHDFEYRMRNKSGQWRWIRDVVTVVRENGSVVCLRGIMIDITELKEAEEGQEFERRNKIAIINSTGDLMWSVTPDKKLITGNEAFLESIYYLSGRRFQPGDSVMSIYDFPKDYWETWDALYNRALAGESFRYEMRTPTLVQGKEYWFETSFNPIMEGDKVIGVACYSRDTSTNKEYTQRLEENNARFREIAWMQSHIVRPPLARIKGINSLIQSISLCEDPETYNRLLGYLEFSTQELDDILQQIVDKTRQLEGDKK